MSGVILSIDQGTTGTTAAFFDAADLRLLSKETVEFPQHYPAPGLVEHAADEIWTSVLTAISVAQEKLDNCDIHKLEAIGITNQRETVIAWNRETGETAGNAIVWQDRRTSSSCAALKAKPGVSDMIADRTGLVLDPYFSASKMAWILEHYPKAGEWAARGTLALGTVDSYLIYRLTHGASYVTDDTNSSRTMLYNLSSGDYDDDLLALFGVTRPMLPEIRPSVSILGTTRRVPWLHDGIPICGCLGDQQAALLGQGGTSAGDAKITYGTGAFLLVNTGEKIARSRHGIVTSVGLNNGGNRTFVLEGSAFIAGAAVQFLRDNFGWLASSAESEKLARRAVRDENLVFVPALSGLGAPFWNPDARGAILGLTRGTTKEQIVRAVLESIALQNVHLLQIIEESMEAQVSRVFVDGGAAQNNFLMQFQADMLGRKLLRPGNIESTSAGAARAARMQILPSALQTSSAYSEFAPQISQEEAAAITGKWRAATEWVDRFYARAG